MVGQRILNGNELTASKIISFRLIGGQTPSILFDRSLYSPTNVTMQNIGDKVQLTWQDATGDDE